MSRTAGVFRIVLCAVLFVGAAQGAETVRVTSVKSGTYETKLSDGSVFAYRLETEDPAKPGVDFKILKASPAQTVSLVIPRQHWWRHADAACGEKWVEVVREGQSYRISRAFAPGETVRFTCEFDPDDVPGARARPDAEKVWTADFGDGKPVRFALDGEDRVNLERFRPDHPQFEAATATVSRVVICEKDETRIYGVAADWWFTAFLNGREVYTTWPDGNGTSLTSPYGHVLRLNLKKGENTLAFKISPGSDSWDFLCREFPSRDRWPADAKNRERTYATLFPPTVALKGAPWVTGVSSDRARIGAELTASAKLGVRYWAKAKGRPGVTNERWTVVGGQKDSAKVHLFDLEGLLPATDYGYALVGLDGTACKTFATGAFRTYPARGAHHDFWLVGDTQFDGARRTQVLGEMMKNCGIGGGSFLVSVGDVDNVFDDFSYSYHETFLDVLAKEGLKVPTVLVRGNHEYHGRETTQFPRHFGRPYYSFRHGDVFYFVLDTGEHAQRLDLGDYFDEQAAWLRAEVETDACRTARRHIVLAHAVPFFFDGASGLDVERIVGGVFYGDHPKCKLDLWLCGDIHCAYRWDPLARTLAGRSRVAGWKKPTRADLQQIRFPVFVNDGPNAGWAKQSATHVEISDTAAVVTVVTPDGKTLDKVRYRWGHPFEVLESAYDYKAVVPQDPGVVVIGTGKDAARARAFLRQNGIAEGEGPVWVVFGDSAKALDDETLKAKLVCGGVLVDAAAAKAIAARGFGELVTPNDDDPLVPDKRVRRRSAKRGWTIVMEDESCDIGVLKGHLELAGGAPIAPFRTDLVKPEAFDRLPPALKPVPQVAREPYCWWMQCFLYKRAESAWVKDVAKVVFCGDSITQMFGGEAWDESFGSGKYRAVNCGISGDRTENLIFRLMNGALDNVDPKAAVLLIGVNNVCGRPDEPAETTADAVWECVARIRTAQPKGSKLVLNAIFPCFAKPDDPRRVRVAKVNALLKARLATLDAESRGNILWLDMTDDFLAPDGTLPKELFPDGLHPSQAGYRKWAARLKPLLDQAL